MTKRYVKRCLRSRTLRTCVCGNLRTIKLRQAGFSAVVDTRDAFQAAPQSFIDRNLLPPALD
jgi:hypothetical protein